jgi:O-antigen ligase
LLVETDEGRNRVLRGHRATDGGNSAGDFGARAAIVPVPGQVDAGISLRIVTLLRVALGLLLIANLGRIPAFSTGGRTAPILVNDLVVGALIVAATIVMVRRRSMVLDRAAWFALAFAALGGISAVLSVPRFGLGAFELAASLAYLARWLFYFFVYVIVINFVRRDDVESVWSTLETTILVFAGFGILQSAFLPGFAQIVYPESRLIEDWDPQGHRLVSTFLDPNLAGAFIDIGLIVLLARQAAGARVGTWKLLLLLVALVLTASRSSVLAFVVGVGAIVLLRGLSKRMLRLAMLGAVLSLIALPKVLAYARLYNKLSIDESALQRVNSWVNGLRVLSDHPVIGIGINTWGYVQERYGGLRAHTATYAIDGGLLFVAVMTGFVGLALYLMMLWSIFRRARRVARDVTAPSGHRGLAIGAAATIPVIVTHSLFANSMFFPYVMEALWVVWGLAFSMSALRGATHATDAAHEDRPAPPQLARLVGAR